MNVTWGTMTMTRMSIHMDLMKKTMIITYATRELHSTRLPPVLVVPSTYPGIFQQTRLEPHTSRRLPNGIFHKLLKETARIENITVFDARRRRHS